MLVIGAGGAGLRAAIAASAAGVKVGLVCKSLLGKAHTVMAEGGVAAALGQRGRPRQLAGAFRRHHARRPVREQLRAWPSCTPRRPRTGSGSSRHGARSSTVPPTGASSSGTSADTSYPRLAHVGDRTGLEMIRTSRTTASIRGSTCTWSARSSRSQGRRPHGRRVRLRPRARALSLFRAKAVVLATGGIGRAYPITSNSWEYTGDGHALAYHAGAALQDMEFVQFHPTGMVWPPSVRGILVTEGVRGEGGVLRNSEGQRFMFDDIPDNYRNQTADSEEEGWRYTQGDKNARRPPELLTRDHVARCILREVREGRGSPHGGVFLDISWIREKIPHAPEHIIKKLPSMYHQFKQLADIDITTTPMEVGPTTHYIMGGVRVDGDTQMSTVPGPLRRRRVRRRIARRQPAGRAIRSPTCWCSASGPASSRRHSRGTHRPGEIDVAEVDERSAGARPVRARRERRWRGARTRSSTSCRR